MDDNNLDHLKGITYETISKNQFQEKLMEPGSLIVAARQTGKTTALILYLQNNENAVLLVPNQRSKEFIKSRAPEIANRIYITTSEDALRGVDDAVVDDTGIHRIDKLLNLSMTVSIQSCVCCPSEISRLRGKSTDLKHLHFIKKVYWVDN